MSKIYQIALNTFRESVRDKVLYVIAFFAVLMMVASTALGWVSVGDQLQIVQHFSLAVVSFFGALIAVFVGTGLIYKEIDKRTIYTILSKPIHRWQFVVGKFAGLQAVLVCIVAGMGGVSCLFVYYAAATNDLVNTVNWSLYLHALLLVYFEMMVVTALAILFSTAASPILSAIFTFVAYLIGQVTESLMDLVTFKPVDPEKAQYTGEKLTGFTSELHWLLKPVSEFLYHVLPNLSHFQLRNRVVYGPPLQQGEVLYAVLYALAYSAAVLLVAVLFFDRKRF